MFRCGSGVRTIEAAFQGRRSRLSSEHTGRSALVDGAADAHNRRMTSRTVNPIKDTVRQFNKHVFNPVMLLLAGRKHWYAGVIRHTGRRSGTSYRTPVVLIQTADDGFVVPLPYGTGVDWLRNVLAAGRATVKVNGQTHDVADPEVIDAATAAPLLTPRRRRTNARLGIDKYLRLRRTGHGS